MDGEVHRGLGRDVEGTDLLKESLLVDVASKDADVANTKGGKVRGGAIVLPLESDSSANGPNSRRHRLGDVEVCESGRKGGEEEDRSEHGK